MAWTWPRSPTLNTILANVVPDNAASVCRHPGLLLDHFTPNEAFDKRKRDWLAHIVQKVQLDHDLLKAQRKRWREMVQRFLFGTEVLELQTASRLIVGLGSEHVLETSITLDRNSGAPAIPGSALKGVARTFALIEIAQLLPLSDEQTEKVLNDVDGWLSAKTFHWDKLIEYGLSGLDAETHNTLNTQIETFRRVFGFVGEVGRAVFFNGMHAGSATPFMVDVMTPHFSNYYSASNNHRQAPSDDQNPIPVPYLVVAENQKFLFAVGGRTVDDIELTKQARIWLREGLITYGVGAKTSQGYGIFRELPKEG